LPQDAKVESDCGGSVFGRRIKLFKLLGFQVQVELSWIIIALLVVWSLAANLFPTYYKELSPRTHWLMGIAGAAGLFLSIIAHEFCHSLVARQFGMTMSGITLFIFGGVAEMTEEPPSAKAEFSMAIVGPLSSLAIAVIFYAGYVFGREGRFTDPVNGVLGYLATINAILAGFNLLPAFPLDGGRVLRSILWGLKKNIAWATRISSQIGGGFGVAMAFFGMLQIFRGDLIGGMWWVIIGLFLQSAAKMAYQQLVTRRALEGERVRRFMKKEPVTVPPDITIRQLVDDYIYKHHYKLFPIVDDRDRLLGCVSPRQVKDAPQEEWSTRVVAEVASNCSSENSTSPETDIIEALAAMRRSNVSRLLVVEDNRLAGILTLKDLLDFLALKVELENLPGKGR